MLVITKVEYITTDRDPYEIQSMLYDSRCRPLELSTSDGESKFMDIPVSTEIVRGCRFDSYTVERGRKSMLIGMTKDVQDVLGMQYEAVSTMNERAEEDAKMVAKATKKLKHLKSQMDNASLWSRIKWVFTGVAYNNGNSAAIGDSNE